MESITESLKLVSGSEVEPDTEAGEGQTIVSRRFTRVDDDTLNLDSRLDGEGPARTRVQKRSTDALSHSPKQVLNALYVWAQVSLLFGLANFGVSSYFMPWRSSHLIARPDSYLPFLRCQGLFLGTLFGATLFFLIAFVAMVLAQLMRRMDQAQVLEFSSSAQETMSLCIDALGLTDLRVTRFQTDEGVIEAQQILDLKSLPLSVRIEITEVDGGSRARIQGFHSPAVFDCLVFNMEPRKKIAARLADAIERAAESSIHTSDLSFWNLIPPTVRNQRAVLYGGALSLIACSTLFACSAESGHDSQIIAARYFLGLKQPAAAAVYAAGATATDPDCITAHQLRAEVLADLRDYRGELDELEKAIKLDPDNQWFKLEQSRVMGIIGRVAESMQHTRALLERKDLSPEVEGLARNNLAWGLALVGDGAAAVLEANKAVTTLPREGYHYGTRGYARAITGDLEGALADLTTAVALEPHNSADLFIRSDVYRALGETAKADNDVKRALSFASSRSDAFHGAKVLPVTEFRTRATNLARTQSNQPLSLEF